MRRCADRLPSPLGACRGGEKADIVGSRIRGTARVVRSAALQNQPLSMLQRVRAPNGACARPTIQLEALRPVTTLAWLSQVSAPPGLFPARNTDASGATIFPQPRKPPEKIMALAPQRTSRPIGHFTKSTGTGRHHDTQDHQVCGG